MLLLFGFDAADAAQLAQLLGPDAEVIIAAEEDDALQRLAQAPPGTLLCLGSSLRAEDAAAFLRRASTARAVVLAAGSEPETFQDLIDADQIFFLSRRPPPLDEVAALLRGALRHGQRRREDNAAGGARSAMLVARAISRVVDRIATETDLERISGLVGEAARGLTDAGEARFAVYDPLHETLWFRSLAARETVRNSAAAGLVSFIARTGEALALDRAGDDPRYDPDADNDGRSPQERFLGVPMLAPGAAFADTLGVLVVTREPGIALGGAIFTESIYSLPGLGRQVLQSYENFDLPVIQGIVVFSTLCIIVLNLIVDLLYAVIDPRIRLT